MPKTKQGTKEVVDYIREFEQLKIRTNVKEAEEYTIARFIGGLNSTIAEKLELQPLWTFEDACKMAITMDKQAKKRVPYKPISRPTFPARNYTSNEFESASNSLKRKEKIGEGSKDPKGRNVSSVMVLIISKFQAQCPNQRARTLKEIEDLQREIETEDEQPVFDESNEEETVGVDCGDMLVVRRAMHMVEAPKDKTQRENIFHSRCIVKGKHQIDLVPGSILPNKEAYRCSPHEAKELQKQVDELVAQGYVRASTSPCSIPALSVPKKMVLRIDLRSGYHQIRIREGDEWKITFKIKGGLFEWLVMPFGLSNAPSTFMRLMNEVLRPLTGNGTKLCSKGATAGAIATMGETTATGATSPSANSFVLIIPYDSSTIRVSSKSSINFCYKSSFTAKIGLVTSPLSMDIIVSKEGIYGSIKGGSNKILALPIFYHRAQAAFECLKDKLSSTLILALPNFDMLFELECDASGVGIGAVLVQEKRPVAYFSEKLNGSKLNYSTYNKEFYAMVRAIDHWKEYGNECSSPHPMWLRHFARHLTMSSPNLEGEDDAGVSEVSVLPNEPHKSLMDIFHDRKNIFHLWTHIYNGSLRYNILGRTYSTFDDAYDFYNEYGLSKGFGMKPSEITKIVNAFRGGKECHGIIMHFKEKAELDTDFYFAIDINEDGDDETNRAIERGEAEN
nr:hypothetical protein [Tanacetum cinerariifolium]